MAKIDWSRHEFTSKLDRDYYLNPRRGFDQQWHDKQSKLKAQRQTLAKNKALASIRANKAKRNIIT